MTTGDAIRQMRRKSGFTQEKLAELLNTGRPTISSWENNIFLPGTENILALSKLFNCSTDDILNPTQPPPCEMEAGEVKQESLAS